MERCGALIEECLFIGMIQSDDRPHNLEYPMPIEGLMKGDRYSLWPQVGGYFDGDGSVYLNASSPNVLKIELIWVDNCFDQLLQLRAFLISQGIAVGRVLVHCPGVYRLQIGSPESVLKCARTMLPFCFKKYHELKAAIDYYENKVTGTEVLLKMNQAVSLGSRVGKIREVKLLPKYLEGKHTANRNRGLRVAELWRIRKLEQV